MAHIKAQNINWLDQAWRISSVIADMPDGPPMGLLAGVGKPPPLHDRHRVLIEKLQDRIAFHLAYRVRVVHKHRKTFPDGSTRMFICEQRDPIATLQAYAALQSIGVKLTDLDMWALEAHLKLGRILIDRYVCKDWKRQLPLIVASISGASTSETATLNQKQRRAVDRRSPLAQAVWQQRRDDPFASAMEVLDRLCGGDVVKELRDERVFYWDKKGDMQSIGLDRFETIYSEQKPSTG